MCSVGLGQFNERPVLMCQRWHDLAWDHSITVPCKTCVTRIWQFSERKPNLSLEASFQTFLFTKCVGLPFRTLPGQTLPRITQGAFLVGATSPGLWNNLPSPFAVLSHKSHCLKRKWSSTSAAETQIMSEALEGVEWIPGLFEELTNPNFSIVEWAARSRNRGLLIAARSSDSEVRFPEVLSIGDAKSLYDHLDTET